MCLIVIDRRFDMETQETKPQGIPIELRILLGVIAGAVLVLMLKIVGVL